MTGLRLAFFKLNVPAMPQALEFWHTAFGFAVTQTFDEPGFLEHILVFPGQEDGPSLMLVTYKDGREVTPGPGHGPVGLTCDDIAAAHARAETAGARPVTGIFAVGAVKVAILLSPDGHEIELVEL
ncbi:MAG: VOC family protein [Croceibacterium sp.]